MAMAPAAKKKTKTATKKTVQKKTAAQKKTTARKTVTKRTPTKRKAATKPAAKKRSGSQPPSLPPGTPLTEALGETFLRDLIGDWSANGGGVIEDCRRNKPDVYLRLIATYAPKEFRKTLDPFESMNDADLKRSLAEALEDIRALGFDQGTGTGP